MSHLSDMNECNMTAEQADYVALVETQTAVYDRNFGPMAPQVYAEAFVDTADPHKDWHRPYGLDHAFSALKTTDSDTLLLLPILVCFFTFLRDDNHDSTVIDGLYDANVMRLIALEVLFRTDPACRSKTFRECIDHVTFPVFDNQQRPGHNAWTNWHSLQQLCTDYEPVERMCNAYNDVFPTLINFAPYIVKDETIVEKGGVAHVAKKPHQRGFEFLVDAMPVDVAGASVATRLVAHVWHRKRGPNLFQLFCESVDVYWASPDPAQRPLIVGDARFSVRKTLYYVMEEMRGPFIFSINAAYHPNVVQHMVNELDLARRTVFESSFNGCVTLIAGTKEYPHLPPTDRPPRSQQGRATPAKRARESAETAPTVVQSSEPNVERQPTTPSTAAADCAVAMTSASASTRVQPSRVRRPPQKFLEDDFVIEFERAFGDAPPRIAHDPVPEEVQPPTLDSNDLPSDMMILAEAYEGRDKRKRSKVMVLISNFVFGYRRSRGSMEDPKWPLFRLFQKTWRRVDQLNKFLKYRGMLRQHGSRHSFSDTAARIDFVVSIALRLSCVLLAKLEGRLADGTDQETAWKDFGERLVEQSRRLGGQSQAAIQVVVLKVVQIFRNLTCIFCPNFFSLQSNFVFDKRRSVSNVVKHFLDLLRK
jgi:hypothetical protein